MSSPHARRRSIRLVAVAVLWLLAEAVPALASDPPPTTLGDIDLDKATVLELQDAMDAGELTSADLVLFYLDRIEALDPQLNAIIAVSPTALEDAGAADAARADGVSGPLLGIPVMIKDNIGTAGMPTTAGSLALERSVPPDAFLVSRLRDAGAVILGKANLSEWANMRSLPSSSGWSAIGGQTNTRMRSTGTPAARARGRRSGSPRPSRRSPWVARPTVRSSAPRAPTPSSASSPRSVSSAAGIVPITAQQDTAGPMARNVTDAAALLGAMSGSDAADSATADADAKIDDFIAALDPDALDGARIGVWRAGTFGINPPVDEIVEETIGRQELGATIVDPTDLALDPVFEYEYPALLCEFKHDIAAYLSTLDPTAPKTLQDLIDFNLAHADAEMATFKQEIFDEAEAAPDIDDPSCTEARTTTDTARAAIDETIAADDLDAIVAPAAEPAWLTDPVAGDAYVGPFTSSAAAASGYPNVTIPVGYVAGLPVGISFIGAQWADAELLGLAYALEQTIDARVPPPYQATVADPAQIVTPAPAPAEAPAAVAAPTAEGAPEASPSPAG